MNPRSSRDGCGYSAYVRATGHGGGRPVTEPTRLAALASRHRSFISLKRTCTHMSWKRSSPSLYSHRSTRAPAPPAALLSPPPLLGVATPTPFPSPPPPPPPSSSGSPLPISPKPPHSSSGSSALQLVAPHSSSSRSLSPSSLPSPPLPPPPSSLLVPPHVTLIMSGAVFDRILRSSSSSHAAPLRVYAWRWPLGIEM